MKKETSNPGTGTVHKKSLKQQIYYYRSFYIMFIPVFIFAVVFHYLPMLGIRYSLFSYKGIKAPELIWQILSVCFPCRAFGAPLEIRSC